MIKRCLCSLDIRLGKKNPQESGSSARFEFMFQPPSCLSKETGGGKEKGRRVGIELPGNQDSPSDSGIADEMVREKKGGRRKQSHLSAPAEKSIKANAYVNICRGHNGPIFRV